MPISVKCPACSKPANLPDNAVGRKARCKCGASFTVTAHEEYEGMVLEDAPPPIAAQPNVAAKSLRCDSCGAALTSASNTCQYCGNEAAIVINGMPLCQLLEMYILTEQYKDAESIAGEILKTHPKNALAWATKGLCGLKLQTCTAEAASKCFQMAEQFGRETEALRCIRLNAGLAALLRAKSNIDSANWIANIEDNQTKISNCLLYAKIAFDVMAGSEKERGSVREFVTKTHERLKSRYNVGFNTDKLNNWFGIEDIAQPSDAEKVESKGISTIGGVVFILGSIPLIIICIIYYSFIRDNFGLCCGIAVVIGVIILAAMGSTACPKCGAWVSGAVVRKDIGIPHLEVRTDTQNNRQYHVNVTPYTETVICKTCKRTYTRQGAMESKT